MRYFLFVTLAVMTFALANATEISAPGEPSATRRSMEEITLPSFTLKNKGVWESINTLNRAMKSAKPDVPPVEFLLKATDEEAPQKITLYLPDSKVSDILDAIARQADCVWFCTNETVVVVPAGKIILDYGPRDIQRSPRSPCSIILEKKEVTTEKVAFHWVLTVSGVSKELFMPNLTFQIIPRDINGMAIAEKPQLKVEPLERAAGFGKYRYTMTMSDINADARTLNVKVMYSGEEIFQQNIQLGNESMVDLPAKKEKPIPVTPKSITQKLKDEPTSIPSPASQFSPSGSAAPVSTDLEKNTPANEGMNL